MQFRKAQRAELARNWGKDSWFWVNLDQPSRDTIELAFGIKACHPNDRPKYQAIVTKCVGDFADAIKAEKGQVYHALLSGSVKHLILAIAKKHQGKKGDWLGPNPSELIKPWQEAFGSK